MYRVHTLSSEFCLICFEPKLYGMLDKLWVEDPLCSECRSKMMYRPIKFKVETMEVTSLYVYKGFVRTQIIQYKESFDELLYCIFIVPYFMRLKLFYNDYVVVYVPSTQTSFSRRGFDHMKMIASCMGLEVLDNVLSKMESPKQSLLNFEERRDVSKYLKVKNIDNIKDRKVILIDDVVTTGSSLKACYDLISPYCRKIKVIGLCVHPKLLING